MFLFQIECFTSCTHYKYLLGKWIIYPMDIGGSPVSRFLMDEPTRRQNPGMHGLMVERGRVTTQKENRRI